MNATVPADPNQEDGAWKDGDISVFSKLKKKKSPHSLTLNCRKTTTGKQSLCWQQSKTNRVCTSSEDRRPTLVFFFFKWMLWTLKPWSDLFFQTQKVSSTNFHSAPRLISVLSISRPHISHLEIMTLSWGRQRGEGCKEDQPTCSCRPPLFLVYKDEMGMRSARVTISHQCGD